MILPIEFRQLRYVVAVAEELHFTRAAERLHLTQSALTRQIAQLEESLGVRLFKRDTRHVELTAAGEVFIEEAKRVLESAHRAVALAQGTQRRDQGEIRIAYSPLVDLQVAGELKRLLASSNPTLQVSFSGMSIKQQISGILDGSYPLGLAVLPVDDPALFTEVLLSQPLAAVLPTAHRLARKRHIDLRDLDDDLIVWIPPSLHSSFYAHFMAWCRSAGYHPTVAQEATGIAECLQFVADGIGISFAAESVRRLQFPGVVIRRVWSPSFLVETGLICRRDNKSTVLQQILKAAVQHFTPRESSSVQAVSDDLPPSPGTQANH